MGAVELGTCEVRMYCSREGEEMSFDFSCVGEQREKTIQEAARPCLFIQVWGISGEFGAKIYGVIKRHSFTSSFYPILGTSLADFILKIEERIGESS